MSTTRLTFLYPHLFRSTRDPAIQTLRARARRPIPQCQHVKKGFATSRPHRESLIQRHGKAVEPYLVQGEDADSVKVFTPESASQDETSQSEPPKKKPPPKAAPADTGSLSDETLAAMNLPGDPGMPIPMPPPAAKKDSADTAKEAKAPLETVLQMPPPKTQEEENTEKPPHLQAPPYVHHFDTYTLVREVEGGGFTPEQSVTTMKAVRGLLAQNMDIARRGLVSKSDVENESYLFRAACSELKTEVQNARKASDEKMRRERTLLQHEVDILSQKLTQELLTLKDDLKGMFDDRKMSVRSEQRAMESAIQGLNYKITVDLNSDSKSEVEGVRWVLTRRSVMAILFMAFMVLSSLRYGSYMAHEEENRKKREKKLAEERHEERREEPREVSAAEILAAN